MIKGIIFDLDGTIIDTLDDLTSAVNFALQKLSFPTLTRREVGLRIGHGTHYLLYHCCPDQVSDELKEKSYEIFTEYYSNHLIDASKPFDGTIESIKKIKDMGYRVFVLSNKDHELAQKIAKHFFGDLFEYVQGTYVDFPKKPSKELTEKLLETIGLNKDEAVLIGDSEVDIETANNAGVKGLLVSYGYRSIDELNKTCPLIPKCQDVKLLPDFIKENI